MVGFFIYSYVRKYLSAGRLFLNAERETRSAERLCSAELRKQGKIILVRNAERGVRNDFIPLTLHSQGKN